MKLLVMLQISKRDTYNLAMKAFHSSVTLVTLKIRPRSTKPIHILTNISLASFLWDKGKLRKPRSDAAERGVWSGSPLFAYRMFYWNFNENVKYHQTTHKTEMDWTKS